MKKIYLLFIALSFLPAGKTAAQCAVNITSNIATTQLNCTIKTIRLTAGAAGTKGQVTFAWSNGAATASINVTAAANYVVTISDTTGCTSSSSINITQDSTAPLVKILPFPDTICRGGTATFVALGATSYSWQPGTQTGNPISVNPNITTSYTVIGTASNGCTGKDSFKMVVNQLPTASIGGTTTVCQNSANPVVTFTGLTGAGPFTFSYDINGGTTQIITTTGNSSSVTVNAPTQILRLFRYNLKSVTDSKGCTQLQNGTAQITVNQGPVLTSTKDTSICDNVLLNYTATSSVAGTTFSWTRDIVDGVSNGAGSSGLSPDPAIINETLHNTTDTAVAVNYIFTLTSGNGATCMGTNTVKVIVNPTPVLKKINDTAICNGSPVNGINFSSNSPDSSFTWSCNPGIGFGSSGSGSISGFTATNNGISNVVASVNVKITASSNHCQGPDAAFKITVFPAPLLTSKKDTSVCNNIPFRYTATSSAAATKFRWTREFVSGVTNPYKEDSVNSINETLTNESTQPVVVKYRFTLSTGSGCDTKDSVLLTVNPTPQINKINPPPPFCNGTRVQPISFSSASPNAVFTWVSDTTIGFGLTGSDSIPAFNASNLGTAAVTANITVKIAASSDRCPGPDSSFKITVFPGPSLTSKKDTSVCNNVPFSYIATSSATATTYRWTREFVSGVTNPFKQDSVNIINETLINYITQPVVVKYKFTLSTGSGCDTKDSVLLTVNPTPQINKINPPPPFCNGTRVQPISFSSASPNAVFTWVSDTTIGFGLTGSDSIPAFNASNLGTAAVTATIIVKITASGDHCTGPDSSFKITVFPGPLLTSKKDTSICNNVQFSYTATSSAAATTYRWTREFVTGVTNPFKQDSVNMINETLTNDTTQPVVVKYKFTLTTASGCDTKDSILLTVNPTPQINKINQPPPFCNGITVQPISFSSTSPNAAFTWVSDTAVGFGLTGSDSIPSFIASNMGFTPIDATVTVKITASSDRCPGPDSSFKIRVNPSPQKPSFTSLSRFPDNEALKLCTGSENINFNVNVPVAGISYNWGWTLLSGQPVPLIKNTNQPSTAISFRNAGLVSINLQVTDSLTCANNASQIVQVGPAIGIDERKIFVKQPGNLLIYPDNSLDAVSGYQWGYDSLIQTNQSKAFTPPIAVKDQVYQTFIPEARFISNNQLDTINRAFWVLLQQGSCYSRVYYNGPYARLRNAVTPPADNTVHLKIAPNPNNGIFEINLQGNIYGNIEARIYNTVGQVVLQKAFTKNTPGTIEKINTHNFPNGLYFLELHSSDLKKVVSRFIIQH